MNTPINIEELHSAMVAATLARFPTLKTCDYYPRPGEKIAVPAVLFELDSIASNDDAGTEQLPVRLQWNAYIVRSNKQGKKMAVRTLTAAVMAFLRGKRFDQPVGPTMVGDAVPDLFDGESQGTNAYECMRVPFDHEAWLGDDVWHDDGDVPETVFAAQEPTTGDAGDYDQIVP